ncbi:hypothetical protein GP486_000396 [Trichoglossum hirsutum]|uniref:cAMP-independent regulatory protein pac2 n=1 Tax=Trichoglossum hirsutum TaxID=265104 RepID=A0A9P8LJ01_9PEZI|nr:hypothetical protein GP486_000396 [Trichoglossum hirsutum]
MALSPTFIGTIRTANDLQVLVDECNKGILQPIKRAPTADEMRDLAKSGNVIVYNMKTSGICRWRDGHTWSPGAHDGQFYIYRELTGSYQKVDLSPTIKVGGLTKKIVTQSPYRFIAYSCEGTADHDQLQTPTGWAESKQKRDDSILSTAPWTTDKDVLIERPPLPARGDPIPSATPLIRGYVRIDRPTLPTRDNSTLNVNPLIGIERLPIPARDDSLFSGTPLIRGQNVLIEHPPLPARDDSIFNTNPLTGDRNVCIEAGYPPLPARFCREGKDCMGKYRVWVGGGRAG